MTLATVPRRRRPFGVWMLIIAQILSTLLTGLVLGVAFIALSGLVPNAELDLTRDQIALLVVEFVLSSVSAYGLWRMQRWAWFLTMLDLGISMVSDIYLYYNDQPNYSGMLLNVIIVLYLSQREVQNAFEQRKRPKATIQPASSEEVL